MRYIMSSKFFSYGMMVKDDRGREVFFIKRAFSLRPRWIIKRGDAELATIQQALALRPIYEIRRSHGPTARASLKLLSFNDRIKIELPGEDGFEAQGDFLDHEYTIYRGGRVAAQISKRWLSLRDTYVIDVHRGQDDVFIIACAVVINAIHDTRDTNAAS